MKLNGLYGEATIYAKTVEESALLQIQSLVDHKISTGQKIRIMPDVHAGSGCTIGTTMTITDKVVPDLVGVDIGCFVGDTKIPLINGTQKTLKELYELNQEFWVYSINKNNAIVAGKANALITRKNAELLKVTISGGCEIICTPDHEFMLRNGEYKEAKDLIYKDSLMPLYRTYQTRDGYESLLQPSREMITKPTHIVVAEQMFGQIPKGYAVHHKNENQFDNSPENLELLMVEEHNRLHAKKPKVITRLKSKEFKKMRIEKLNDTGFYDIKFTEKKKEVGIQNITNYMEQNPEKFKDDIKDNGIRGSKYLVGYNQSEKGKTKSKEMSNRLYECGICGIKIKSYIGLHNHKKKEHNNHKVVSIEILNYTEDVYCLNVNEYHNFALSAGVFVHNCGMYTAKLNAPLDVEKLDAYIRKSIPSGFNVREKAHFLSDYVELNELFCIDSVNAERAILSVGTLGGGNHFIEVSEGVDGSQYLVIHTGSRNVGKQVADIYQKQAIKECFFGAKVSGVERDLAWLEGKGFANYIHDMKIMQEYAHMNRFAIAQDICNAMDCHIDVSFETVHNYIDTKIMMLRKGAVSAKEGELLLIPMNMRDGSLLCIGKGNDEWNQSAPHGAGRIMSRRQAKETINMDEYRKSMDGIFSTSVTESTIDEAPFAYKPMEEILEQIKDTVEVIDVLKPIYNFKST